MTATEVVARQKVSIHALLVECDYCSGVGPLHCLRFNPRTPCGVRPGRHHANLDRRGFNPRTPCGVRQTMNADKTYNVRVSIHALLVECDVFILRVFLFPRCFNPRTPCGVRPPDWRRADTVCRFNPRTPCGVRPDHRLVRRYVHGFNPRTPCGVRPCSRPGGPLPGGFNPRTPCGVRLQRPGCPGFTGGFNPRTPCGVRQWYELQEVAFAQFQSTHSLWSATAALVREAVTSFVSIHALLVECDPAAGSSWGLPECFNPRTPCGVRPLLGDSGNRDSRFQSTHSLWSATHPDRHGNGGKRVGFNPRTPCGVRRPRGLPGPGLGCFNPRTPCGVRLKKPTVLKTFFRFQSTHSLWSATGSVPSLG